MSEQTVVAPVVSSVARPEIGFGDLREFVVNSGGCITVVVRGGGTRVVTAHELTSLCCSCCGKYLFRGKGPHEFVCVDPEATILELRCARCVVVVEAFGIGDADVSETATEQVVVGGQISQTVFPANALVVSSSIKLNGSAKRSAGCANSKPRLRREKVTGEMKFRHGARTQRGRVASLGRR